MKSTCKIDVYVTVAAIGSPNILGQFHKNMAKVTRRFPSPVLLPFMHGEWVVHKTNIVVT